MYTRCIKGLSRPQDSLDHRTLSTTGLSRPQDSLDHRTLSTTGLSRPQDSLDHRTISTTGLSRPQDYLDHRTISTTGLSRPQDSPYERFLSLPEDSGRCHTYIHKFKHPHTPMCPIPSHVSCTIPCVVYHPMCAVPCVLTYRISTLHILNFHPRCHGNLIATPDLEQSILPCTRSQASEHIPPAP